LEAPGALKPKPKGQRRPAPSAITIREARRADARLVLGFIRALASYERLLGEVEATEARIRRTLFPAGRRAPAARVLIGEVGGRPAGFALYFFNYSTFLGRPGIYLEDIFVEPKYRRLGLGRALLLRVGAIARRRGCGRLEWSVLDWNRPAIDFYRSLGARALDEWTVFRIAGAALRRLPRS
jgi:GNAT superfamily N-acetyltransferase